MGGAAAVTGVLALAKRKGGQRVGLIGLTEHAERHGAQRPGTYHPTWGDRDVLKPTRRPSRACRRDVVCQEKFDPKPCDARHLTGAITLRSARNMPECSPMTRAFRQLAARSRERDKGGRLRSTHIRQRGNSKVADREHWRRDAGRSRRALAGSSAGVPGPSRHRRTRGVAID